MKTQRIFCAIVVSTLAGMFIACGAKTKIEEASARVKYTNDMIQFGIAMLNCEAANNGRMPNSVDELVKKVEVSPDSLALVKSGELNVVWGPWRLNDQLSGSTNTIMSWSNAPIFKGNVGVIMCDGSFRNVSPAEFAAMPKAKAKPGTESPIRK